MGSSLTMAAMPSMTSAVAMDGRAVRRPRIKAFLSMAIILFLMKRGAAFNSAPWYTIRGVGTLLLLDAFDGGVFRFGGFGADPAQGIRFDGKLGVLFEVLFHLLEHFLLFLRHEVGLELFLYLGEGKDAGGALAGELDDVKTEFGLDDPGGFPF